MDKLVEEYLSTGKALQQKYQDLRFGKMIRREEMIERYKPIIEPLQSINNNMVESSNRSFDKLQDTYGMGKIASKYIGLLDAKSVDYDKVYGLHRDPNDGSLFLGCEPVDVKNDSITLVNPNVTFEGTPGLWELICLNKPKTYDPIDVEHYEELIIFTRVHIQNNDPTSTAIKSSRSYKYKNFIKPAIQKFAEKRKLEYQLREARQQLASLSASTSYVSSQSQSPATPPRPSSKRKKTGGGLRKKSINRPVEYVYWNTVEELLDRLCILYGEIKSGNTNPLLTNEIINIIQEFKEI